MKVDKFSFSHHGKLLNKVRSTIDKVVFFDFKEDDVIIDTSTKDGNKEFDFLKSRGLSPVAVLEEDKQDKED